MPLLVLSLALVTIAYAAPPIVPPADLAPCVDGVNNVVQLADVVDSVPTIHAIDVVAQTYDANGHPSCHNGRAAVSLPGQIKLVRGTVVVTAANPDMKNAELKLSLKKNSIFIGQVCTYGVKKKAQVPADFCHHKIYPGIGDKFLQMLSTPGTYDMEKIEKEGHLSNIIHVPGISKNLNNFVVKGDWQAQLAIELAGRRIAHIKAPSNTPLALRQLGLLVYQKQVLHNFARISQ
ncbi:hypothetical protein COOONC_04807 [Cooperia oncophora]